MTDDREGPPLPAGWALEQEPYDPADPGWWVLRLNGEVVAVQLLGLGSPWPWAADHARRFAVASRGRAQRCYALVDQLRDAATALSELARELPQTGHYLASIAEQTRTHAELLAERAGAMQVPDPPDEWGTRS